MDNNVTFNKKEQKWKLLTYFFLDNILKNVP